MHCCSVYTFYFDVGSVYIRDVDGFRILVLCGCSRLLSVSR